MKIYCVQHDIAWENRRANFTKVEGLLAGAKPEAGSLVLLPEMFASGFSLNVTAIREGRERETERFLAATAKKFGVFLLGAVLSDFFSKYVSLNSFTQTVLRTVERGEVMRWPINIGRRQIV